MSVRLWGRTALGPDSSVISARLSVILLGPEIIMTTAQEPSVLPIAQIDATLPSFIVGRLGKMLRGDGVVGEILQ